MLFRSPVRSVQAMMRQTALHHLEAEDWAGALFDMQCGAFGTLLATTAAYPGGAETIVVQGTKAAAHLGSGVLEISYLDGRKTRVGAEGATGGGADPMALPMNGIKASLRILPRLCAAAASP